MVRARSTASRLKTFMVYVFLTALVGFVLLPFVQMLLLSFTSTLPRDGIAQWQFSTINFQNIIASPLLSGSIVNSIIYVSLNVIVTLLVAIPAAYAIARYRFTGDKHVFLLLIAFRITPPVVLTLPVFILFAKVGLVNTPVGIALVHCVFNIPIAIWILESFISAVPRELDETAFLDGYSLPRFFVRQLLPLIAPGVGSGGVLLLHVFMGGGGVCADPDGDRWQAHHHGHQYALRLQNRHRSGHGHDACVPHPRTGRHLFRQEPYCQGVHRQDLRQSQVVAGLHCVIVSLSG
jgi:ABC-type glycerol-3-phosphate transport system permease component